MKCASRVHCIVLQEQWIWALHDVLLQGLKKKQSGRLTQHVNELYLMRARTLAFSTFTPQMVRKRLVWDYV